MGPTYTKTDLIKELAQSARISRRRVEAVLDGLMQVAYREARQGFAVPGICRLDVVHRKARQIRNPQSGEILLIAEHDALRVRPVKRARDAVAPTQRARVQVVAAPQVAPAATAVSAAAEPAPQTPVAAPTPVAAEAPAAPTPEAATAQPATQPNPQPAAAPATDPAPTPAEPAAAESAAPASEEEFLSFRCKACGQEIEAPVEMADTPSECPTCGASLIVPYLSEPGTIWDRSVSAASSERPPPDAKTAEAKKGRTIRIDLSDEI